ncbi:MAG: type II toxin-antitoxin system HicA family toxin [bacterium]|nr:type II toxin-antitoxin system HicA family toxin [bacterium]
MPKLPIVSGKQMIKVLQKVGYTIARQRSSHIRLYHPEREPVTVPDYKTIGRGLLRKILRETQVSVEDFVRLLKQK